jgi:hypothetical protein
MTIDNTQNTTDNSIINALKRLERAGKDNSRATQKLREAAIDVAQFVIDSTPRAFICKELARGYKVLGIESNVGKEYYFRVRGTGYDCTSRFLCIAKGHYQHGDFNAWVDAATREDVLSFAADVANGLLDEIATQFEAATVQDASATDTLKNAIS